MRLNLLTKVKVLRSSSHTMLVRMAYTMTLIISKMKLLKIMKIKLKIVSSVKKSPMKFLNEKQYPMHLKMSNNQQ